MVAISELFSLLGSSKSKLLILSTGAECSGSVPEFPRSLISEHVSTEALLLLESQRQTPLGAALRRAKKAGRTADDQTILAVMRRWFFARRAESGFRLVGFPRNTLQALVLDEWLETRGESLDACLQIVLPNGGGAPAAPFYRQCGLLVEIDPTKVEALSRP